MLENSLTREFHFYGSMANIFWEVQIYPIYSNSSLFASCPWECTTLRCFVTPHYTYSSAVMRVWYDSYVQLNL